MKNQMFNLKAKGGNTPDASDRRASVGGVSDRSPSPLNTTKPRPLASSSATATMFDIGKKNDHGYIPGARPRSQPPIQPQTQASQQDGGRGRSASRESRETKHSSRSSTPAAPAAPIAAPTAPAAEINVEDIYSAIPVGSSKLTLDEIKKLLIGYVPLPKPYWSTELVYRQHIRYTRLKDNMFVRGGFIIGFGKQRGRATLTLANGFDPKKRGYYVWVIGLDSIGKLFVKRDSVDASRETP